MFLFEMIGIFFLIDPYLSVFLKRSFINLSKTAIRLRHSKEQLTCNVIQTCLWQKTLQ